MSEIIGAAGSIASASIQAGAIKKATQMQIDALEKQRQFVYDELDPTKVGGASLNADIDRAKNRLALQSQIDPDLLSSRYAAEGKISKQLGELGSGSPEDLVAQLATKEGMAGVPGMQEGKKQLVDAALKELSAGATLPPDVQAELVKAGLERSGMTTGSASPKGFGGQILRELIGSAGLQLKQQRMTNAQNLLGRAQQLEESRQQLLGTLFPRLAQTQLSVLGGAQNVLQQSNQMVPEAGIGGTDVANIWLSRVGATNQLAQSAADAAARGGMGAAQAWGTGLGAATNYAAKAAPSTASTWGSLFGGGSGSDYSFAPVSGGV